MLNRYLSFSSCSLCFLITDSTCTSFCCHWTHYDSDNLGKCIILVNEESCTYSVLNLLWRYDYSHATCLVKLWLADRILGVWLQKLQSSFKKKKGKSQQITCFNVEVITRKEVAVYKRITCELQLWADFSLSYIDTEKLEAFGVFESRCHTVQQCPNGFVHPWCTEDILSLQNINRNNC